MKDHGNGAAPAASVRISEYNLPVPSICETVPRPHSRFKSQSYPIIPRNMALMAHSGAGLPHTEETPSPAALAAAKALIDAEMASDDTAVLHPSIPSQREPRYSDLIEAEHARVASGNQKLESLDFSRYNMLAAPEAGNLTEWRTTLNKAYANAEYLRGRETNLGLLESFGKNAWLIGNNNLEDELRALEREVESAKLEQEQIEQARSATQKNSSTEIQSLEEAWKTGVGRMIEAQAAGERLRLEILQRRRETAS